MAVSSMLVANLAACGSALIFGASVVAARVVVQELPPTSVAVLRSSQGGLILLAVLLLTRGQRPRLALHGLPWLLLVAAIMALGPLATNAGLQLTEAARGGVMMASTPIWTALLARLLGEEVLRPRQVAGMLLTIAGIALLLAERGLALENGPGGLLGDALLLFGAFCLATYRVLGRRASRRYGTLELTTITTLLGTLLVLPFALHDGLLASVPQLAPRTLALVAFMGIVAGALGGFLWTYGLTRLKPTQAAVYGPLTPLTAASLGALLLGESLAGPFIPAFATVLVGVGLVNWPDQRRRRAPGADPTVAAG